MLELKIKEMYANRQKNYAKLFWASDFVLNVKNFFHVGTLRDIANFVTSFLTPNVSLSRELSGQNAISVCSSIGFTLVCLREFFCCTTLLFAKIYKKQYSK